jgi:LacI family transcriptional regulator
MAMVTIGDVARRVGVSRTTVSHAFSGRRPVAPATRARILAAAEELCYYPNAMARSVRAGRTQTIGLSVLLDTPGRGLAHGPFSEFIEYIADHLNEHGHKLLTLVAREPAPADLVGLVRSGQVDGLLLLQVRLNDGRVAALRRTAQPFVCIGRPAEAQGLVCVDADLAEAGALAARHLFTLGHRRLGFLGKTPIFGYQYHALDGFSLAHHAAGLPLDPSQLLDVEPSAGLRGALAPYFASTPSLTGLITTTDIEAVSAMHVLTGQGLRVPEDVSIITLGDSTLAQFVRPAITAVSFSVRDECTLAVYLLLTMLSGQTPRQHIHILPVHLLSRHSTGPPGSEWRAPYVKDAGHSSGQPGGGAAGPASGV